MVLLSLLLVTVVLVVAAFFINKKKNASKPSLAQYFRGKRVLVTGASSGIGEELAYQLAACNAKIVVCARRVDRLEQVKAKCESLGSDFVRAVPCDVSDVANCKKLIEESVELLGGLDVLILNAGKGCLLELKSVEDPTVYDDLMRVNYLGYVYPTYYALQHLREAKGQIVVNSSVAGIGWTPGRSAYSATKHALRGFFNCVRCEEPDISITTVYPGFVMSEIHDKAITQGHQLHRKASQFMATDVAVRIILEATRDKLRDKALEITGAISMYTLPFLGSLADRMAIKLAKSAFEDYHID